MSIPKLVLACALLACAPFPVLAQSLQWGPVIDCAPENTGALRPRVVVNANGDPVVLWARSSTLGCFVAVGNDAGFWPPLRIRRTGERAHGHTSRRRARDTHRTDDRADIVALVGS